jgi:hypothetical protein
MRKAASSVCLTRHLTRDWRRPRAPASWPASPDLLHCSILSVLAHDCAGRESLGVELERQRDRRVRPPVREGRSAGVQERAFRAARQRAVELAVLEGDGDRAPWDELILAR